jgi:phage shock protein PspC (stress-responsive transcriptional regulator)
MRKLYLSRTDKKIAGVCGGIAEYFGLDSTLVRLAFVILALLGFSSVIVYIACWFIFPSEEF